MSDQAPTTPQTQTDATAPVTNGAPAPEPAPAPQPTAAEMYQAAVEAQKSKHEQNLVKKYEQENAALQEKIKAMEGHLSPTELKEMLLSNTPEVLNSLGIDASQYVESLAQGLQSPEYTARHVTQQALSPVEQRLQEHANRVEQLEKTLQRTLLTDTARSTLSSASDKFPIVVGEGLWDRVAAVQQQYRESTAQLGNPQEMDVYQAAGIVEKYFRDDALAAQQLAQKYAAVLNPPAAPPQPQPGQMPTPAPAYVPGQHVAPAAVPPQERLPDDPDKRAEVLASQFQQNLANILRQ